MADRSNRNFFSATLSPGSGLPGGPTTSIQFNDGGVFNGQSSFTFTKASGAVVITGVGATGVDGILKVSGPSGTNGQFQVTDGTDKVFFYVNSNSGWMGSVAPATLPFTIFTPGSGGNGVATFFPSGGIFVGTFPWTDPGGSALKFRGYTVALLPAGVEGAITYATNGRKVGEGAGLGTGVPVYFSNGAWRVFSTDAAVAA
jgi:hypothetical protein